MRVFRMIAVYRSVLIIIVYCLLSSVYCLLCAVYCLLCAVYCVLCAVYCLLPTVFCMDVMNISNSTFSSHRSMNANSYKINQMTAVSKYCTLYRTLQAQYLSYLITLLTRYSTIVIVLQEGSSRSGELSNDALHDCGYMKLNSTPIQ